MPSHPWRLPPWKQRVNHGARQARQTASTRQQDAAGNQQDWNNMSSTQEMRRGEKSLIEMLLQVGAEDWAGDQQDAAGDEQQDAANDQQDWNNMISTQQDADQEHADQTNVDQEYAQGNAEQESAGQKTAGQEIADQENAVQEITNANQENEGRETY